jgi:protein ImuB
MVAGTVNRAPAVIYRVEDRQGRRYWIYREGLHGDGRGGDPAWYMHGLFG